MTTRYHHPLHRRRRLLHGTPYATPTVLPFGKRRPRHRGSGWAPANINAIVPVHWRGLQSRYHANLILLSSHIPFSAPPQTPRPRLQLQGKRGACRRCARYSRHPHHQRPRKTVCTTRTFILVITASPPAGRCPAPASASATPRQHSARRCPSHPPCHAAFPPR
jgi:hypothetical protein